MTKNLSSIQKETTIDKNGEIQEKTTTRHFKAEAEPGYIKLYLNNISYLHNLEKSLPPIIFELLNLVNYEQRIVINSFIKKEIAKKIGCSENHINNCITKLVKREIIIRIGRGVYEINTYIFAKGSWKDILKNRTKLKLDIFLNEIAS